MEVSRQRCVFARWDETVQLDAVGLHLGAVTIAYRNGGARDKLALQEGTAIKIGGVAVPVENLVELRLDREPAPS